MPSASTAPSATALPSPSPSLSSPSPATPKLRRILIVNRGEIAMRVIHACHDTGRIAIAAYADPDADALFVHAADEAYALGGSDAQSTYLNIAAIVETAHKAHVDAVHPGYGFLAENAEFAQAVIDAGMTWIGPQPATIRALGSKVEARRIAAEVGAPMAPGTTEPVHDHVEVQILGDGAGNVVAVGTRDCSLQRRNQKLIEEAPAPFLPPETTRALEDAAVAICSSAHYESAGTVEFLVDPDGTMSFMEVNTRIQVEHPVTEEVTGVDLVAAQLAIAEGAHVTDIPGLEHGTPVPHGHAIEFRINVEDPSLGFVPFPGIVERLNVPTGPGIRFDSGVAQGGAIPGQFDSMIAKLIVSAPSRSACLTRARHALDELAIAGVPTVRKFGQAVLEQPAFVATDGDFGVYTRWIEEEFLPSVDVRTLADGKPGRRAAAPEPVESWVEVDGKRVRLGLPASLASVAALGAGLAGLAGAGATGDPALTSDSGESVIQALLNAYQKSVPAGSGTQTAANSDIASTQDTPIESTITGTVVRWLADDGAHVEENEPIVVLEAMKMETEITAPVAGILHRSAQVGDTAQYGDPLGAIS